MLEQTQSYIERQPTEMWRVIALVGSVGLKDMDSDKIQLLPYTLGSVGPDSSRFLSDGMGNLFVDFGTNTPTMEEATDCCINSLLDALEGVAMTNAAEIKAVRAALKKHAPEDDISDAWLCMIDVSERAFVLEGDRRALQESTPEDFL